MNPVQVECRATIIFDIACLGKKLVFHTEICKFREELFLKIGLFHRMKNFFNLNGNRHGVSHEFCT